MVDITSQAHKIDQVLETSFKLSGLDYTKVANTYCGLPGFVVTIPGEAKRAIQTILSIGQYSVRVETFVCRAPDENHENVYRFLLRRNRKFRGLAYTLDDLGDLYLVGKIELKTLTEENIDCILGQIVQTVNTDFNRLLELGFSSSIRKEWAWRIATEQPVENLQDFTHLCSPGDNFSTDVSQLDE